MTPHPRRIRPGAVPLTAIVCGALTWLVPQATAQIPPHHAWRTIETAHFRITFPPELRDLAFHTASRAEVARDRLTEQLAPAPKGVIDILLTDRVDFANGFAMPFPSNRIVLYATPPVSSEALEYYDDWIDLVLVHELVHIYHFDGAGAVGRAARSVFGRVPSGWPLFPAVGIPYWKVEGMAVEFESRLTGYGRIAGSYFEMIVRTAILEDAFDPIDRAGGGTPIWPGGARPYVYGAGFVHHLTLVHGAGVQRRLVEATNSAVIPPAMAFDRVGRRALGRTLTSEWTDWETSLRARYTRLADSLRAIGLTESERLTEGGYWALHPRISPDGSTIAYAADDGRNPAAIRCLDTRTARVRDLSRRNGLAPASWLPDGTGLITSEFERPDRYSIFSRLVRVDRDGTDRPLRGKAFRSERSRATAFHGDRSRGTEAHGTEFHGTEPHGTQFHGTAFHGTELHGTELHGTEWRLLEPDVSPDGRQIVAVEIRGGTNRLVLIELDSGELHAITPFLPDVHWSLPRWHPERRWIAAARSTRGEHDVVVLGAMDTSGSGGEGSPAFGSERFLTLLRVTADPAIDSAPAWSPDGRYLLFSSDITGIPNIHAAEMPENLPGDPRLYQVTHVLTGAFHPDVSPDGRWIVFARYASDGFSIHRMPFDRHAWRADPRDGRRVGRSDGHRDGLRDGLQIGRRDRQDEWVSNRAAGGGANAPASTEGDPGAPELDGTRGSPRSPSRPYSALPTLRPYFWLPVVEDRGTAGFFYGAATGGTDLVGRHFYTAWGSVNPGDERAQWSLSTSHAVLGNPLLGLSVARRWFPSGRVRLTDGTLREVVEREDVASLSTSFFRPRWRTSAVMSVGGDIALRHRSIVNAGVRLVDPTDRLVGARASASWSNAQRHPFSISREDGIALSGLLRRRWDIDRSPHRDHGYSEIAAVGRGYHALPRVGFANSVFGARVAVISRYGPGAGRASLGGAPGGTLDLSVVRLGEGGRFLAVRGFRSGVRAGTRAWAGSIEFRVPVALIGRGYRLVPVLLDRVSASAFADVGDAWTPGRARAAPRPIIGAGAEVSTHLSFFSAVPVRVRVGAGAPVRGPSGDPVVYVSIGDAF